MNLEVEQNYNNINSIQAKIKEILENDKETKKIFKSVIIELELENPAIFEGNEDDDENGILEET